MKNGFVPPHVKACVGLKEGAACSFVGKHKEQINSVRHTCRKKQQLVCGTKKKGKMKGKMKGFFHKLFKFFHHHHKDKHHHGKGKHGDVVVSTSEPSHPPA